MLLAIVSSLFHRCTARDAQYLYEVKSDENVWVRIKMSNVEMQMLNRCLPDIVCYQGWDIVEIFSEILTETFVRIFTLFLKRNIWDTNKTLPPENNAWTDFTFFFGQGKPGNQDSIFRVVRAHTPSVGDARCVKGSAGLNPIIYRFFHRRTSESSQQHFFPENPPSPSCTHPFLCLLFSGIQQKWVGVVIAHRAAEGPIKTGRYFRLPYISSADCLTT